MENYMKIWIDDIRPAPKEYQWWCKSTTEALGLIGCLWEDSVIRQIPCEIFLDIDHDAGDYAKDGGDYINILSTIEEYNERGVTQVIPIVHIHSMNPVGVINMRRIITKNDWKEV